MKTCGRCGSEYSTKKCRPCNARYMRRYKYKLTEEELEEMLNRGCEACGSHDDLSIDHDHACCPGKFTCGKCLRGVLCGSCNVAAGYLRNSPTRCGQLADYLTKFE